MKTPIGSKSVLAANSTADTRTDKLQIVVLYTTPEATKIALSCAETLGQGLGLNLYLLDIQVVPFRCPMDRPPIDPVFTRKRLEDLECKTETPVHAGVVYTRSRDEALRKWLDCASLVLIPVRGFWDRCFTRSLTRTLKKLGHDVLLVPCN